MKLYKCSVSLIFHIDGYPRNIFTWVEKIGVRSSATFRTKCSDNGGSAVGAGNAGGGSDVVSVGNAGIGAGGNGSDVVHVGHAGDGDGINGGSDVVSVGNAGTGAGSNGDVVHVGHAGDGDGINGGSDVVS